MKIMVNQVFVIAAAAGNVTAIKVLNQALTRAEYERIGRDLIESNRAQQVEQAGFLIINDGHFEMSGGEFCGNAARAVAILWSKIKNQEKVEFTMSGFPGRVSGLVQALGGEKFRVTCEFPGMPLIVRPLNLEFPATLVDLGGIVHVVVEADFPRETYTEEHRRLTQELNLGQREAVGVVWVKKIGTSVKMDPVVWVKGVDSFFYETSCGSGSIAVAKVLPVEEIIQPTGEIISVLINDKVVTLKSEMEVKNVSY